MGSIIRLHLISIQFGFRFKRGKLKDLRCFKFDRIGLVPQAGKLKRHNGLVDAIKYEKDLSYVEPEVFDGLVILYSCL